MYFGCTVIFRGVKMASFSKYVVSFQYGKMIFFLQNLYADNQASILNYKQLQVNNYNS